ncbi:MAG: hypothetical protein WCS27_15615, partial [Victivallaceae bacterium]
MKYSQTGSRRSSLLRDKDVRRAELLGYTERKGRGARPHSRLLSAKDQTENRKVNGSELTGTNPEM